MMDDNEINIGDEFRGTHVQVLGTDRDNPEEGRIFVWTKMGWFERAEGPSDDVAFIPVAQSEDELREFISRDDPSFDLVPLSREYQKRVSDEFMDQSPSYRNSPEYQSDRNSPEYSSEDPSEDNEQ
ncbi:hypothetical protein ACFLUH_01780 [Chloroflexota bacterium]